MNEKHDMYNLEKALEAFWKQYGRTVSVHARHTAVSVHPKFIVGNMINQDVAKKILGVYLSQLSSDRVVEGDVEINGDSLKIFDKGQLIFEATSRRLVDSVSNEVTSKLGSELSKKNRKTGDGTYIEPKGVEKFTYGEIRQALVEFLRDSEKNDSKNLLKEAILLLLD